MHTARARRDESCRAPPIFYTLCVHRALENDEIFRLDTWVAAPPLPACSFTILDGFNGAEVEAGEIRLAHAEPGGVKAFHQGMKFVQ